MAAVLKVRTKIGLIDLHLVFELSDQFIFEGLQALSDLSEEAM